MENNFCNLLLASLYTKTSTPWEANSFLLVQTATAMKAENSFEWVSPHAKPPIPLNRYLFIHYLQHMQIQMPAYQLPQRNLSVSHLQALA